MHKKYDYIHLAGIWIRDIRFKSNIQMTQVNKIVKNLESKKLIKAVKSVAVSTIEKLWFFPKTHQSVVQNLFNLIFMLADKT